MSKPVFSNVMTFSGRRNRKSFLLYQLFLHAGVLMAAAIYLVSDPAVTGASTAVSSLGFVLSLIIIGWCVVSGWAVCSQRFRDAGWSGWWVLSTVTPYVGPVIYLALYVVPSDGSNRFGEPLVSVKPVRTIENPGWKE